MNVRKKEKCRIIHFLFKNWRTTLQEELLIFREKSSKCIEECVGILLDMLSVAKFK